MTRRTLFLLLAFLTISLISAGCTDVSIGDVRYKGNSLEVPVTYVGSMTPAFLQVTVYSLDNATQKETNRVIEPFSLAMNQSPVAVPLDLTHGSYKFYIYVTANNERKAGVIRDLVVP